MCAVSVSADNCMHGVRIIILILHSVRIIILIGRAVEGVSAKAF